MPILGPEGKKLQALGNKIAMLRAEEGELSIALKAEQAALEKYLRAQDVTGLAKLATGMKKLKSSTVTIMKGFKKEDTDDFSEQFAAVEQSKSKSDRMRIIDDYIQSLQRKTAEIKAVELELSNLLKKHNANEQQAKKCLINELKEYLQPLRNSANSKEIQKIQEQLDKCLNDNQDQAYPYERARQAVEAVIINAKEPLRKGMEEIVAKWKPTRDDPDVVLTNLNAFTLRENRKIADQIESCITRLETHVNKNKKRYQDVPNSIRIIIQSMQFEKNRFLTENERRSERRPANEAAPDQWEAALEAISYKGPKGELKGFIEAIPMTQDMQDKLQKSVVIKPIQIIADFQEVINNHQVQEFEAPRPS
jgi:signal recognition particle subunit SEC65